MRNAADFRYRAQRMPTPIPERIPPLRWREPIFFWLPLALALAAGWPLALFANDASVQTGILAIAGLALAIALATLGAGWSAGRTPKARRVVVLHIVVAGAIASALAPYLLPSLLGNARTLDLGMALAVAPLALSIGLPAALVSGLAFAWLALTKRPEPEPKPAPPPEPEAPRLRSSSAL
jgi:hypothetical protein